MIYSYYSMINGDEKRGRVYGIYNRTYFKNILSLEIKKILALDDFT